MTSGHGLAAAIDPRFLAFIGVSVVLIATPGPDTALVIRNALRGGARASTLSALGVGIGSLIWAFASVAGVAVVLEGSAATFTVVKFAGAGYLVYLGVRTLVESFAAGAHPRAVMREVARQGRWGGGPFLSLRQGVVNNLLNPKAGAIFVTVLPQFIRPGDPPLRLATMLACYELMVIGWLCGYGYVVSRIGGGGLGTRVSRILERLNSVVMIGLGVRVALESR
jgi:threonine/homoserine/homoserine lactone efflux protein